MVGAALIILWLIIYLMNSKVAEWSVFPERMKWPTVVSAGRHRNGAQ